MYYNYDRDGDYRFDEAPSAQNESPVNSEYHFTYAQPEPEQKKKKPGLGRFIAACLVCAILGGVIGGVVTGFVADGRAEEAPSVNATQLGNTVTPINTNISSSGAVYTAQQIYDSACKSIVGITTEIVGTNIFGQVTSAAASGTGFIISEDGYILTNYHVISGFSSVSVMLHNEESYDAEVVAGDKANDVAVLKIEAPGLTPVTLGNSDELRVGQDIYVIGNPLGELTYTLTGGLISALDRAINTDGTPINMFQIDAAVNSGNSGGPVINAAGEVVGIVTAKYSSSGVEGLGFALPIDDVLAIAQDLIQFGYVTGRPYFGITVSTVSEAAAEYYNMVPGAYIKALDDNSCASKAGLSLGDIIVSIDGEEVLSSSDVVNIKSRHNAGDEIVLRVWRSGEYFDTTVTLDEEPPAAQTQPQEQQTPEESFGDSDEGEYYYIDPFAGTPFEGFLG